VEINSQGVRKFLGSEVLGSEVYFFALRASQGKQGSGVLRIWVQRFRGSGFRGSRSNVQRIDV